MSITKAEKLGHEGRVRAVQATEANEGMDTQLQGAEVEQPGREADTRALLKLLFDDTFNLKMLLKGARELQSYAIEAQCDNTNEDGFSSVAAIMDVCAEKAAALCEAADRLYSSSHRLDGAKTPASDVR